MRPVKRLQLVLLLALTSRAAVLNIPLEGKCVITLINARLGRVKCLLYVPGLCSKLILKCV